MSIYKKLSKMSRDKSMRENLYLLLNSERYKSKQYGTTDLGEGMAVIYQDLWGWWKPRYVLNHNDQTAFEFMDGNEYLVTVTQNDVDWDSLKNLPEEALDVARSLSFHFPSFIRYYENGVAVVSWQLNPDGRYYMDDDGFGMTNDVEIEIYGIIDTNGNVVVKFQKLKDNKDLIRMRREAEEIVRKRKGGI